MTPTSRLYSALNSFLRQGDIQWRDARHLQTLCWMMIGIIQSQNVHPFWFWGVRQEPSDLCPVSPKAIPTLAVKSTH